jgi:type II secretory pathway pseudopilin PulG
MLRGMGRERRDEDGFALIGLVVAIFLILLVLSIAAPKVAMQMRREREVEAVHRANQYTRAIRMYYRRNGNHYPGSIEQLEKTNNIRFLRQKYVDPMTGKADWRLIHFGEAKTKLHGLFGEPLPGMAQGLGSAAGMVSQGQGGAATVDGSGSQNTSSGSAFSNPSSSSGSAFGNSSSGSAFGSTSSSSSFGSSSFGGTSTGSGSGSSFGSAGTSNSSSNSSLTGTSLTGVGAPIVGIGSSAKGSSILALNDQITYETWEFLYDPAIEQLKKGFLGGTVATGLGSASGNMSPGQGNSPTNSPTPTSPSPSPTTTPQ